MNAIELLKKHENVIKEKYHVKKIGIFGSFARSEAKEGSDIDVLVYYRIITSGLKLNYTFSMFPQYVDSTRRPPSSNYIGYRFSCPFQIIYRW
ncbi:MAG: nucleotidyltransferase domain-containing protein [Thermodesulfovibrionales bacterium]|nr:nucleotidyltransferase domain-containing protein [Thermodesulfovibrionales bacterium]